MEIQKTEKYFCQEDGGHQLGYKVMTESTTKEKKLGKWEEAGSMNYMSSILQVRNVLCY